MSDEIENEDIALPEPAPAKVMARSRKLGTAAAESFEAAHPVNRQDQVQVREQSETARPGLGRSSGSRRHGQNGAREMPASEEAESHVLAVILLDPDQLDRAQDHGLTEKSFYWPANQLIFARLIRMKQKGVVLDLSVLVQELIGAKELEAVGGLSYLMQLTGSAPTTAHGQYMIEKVRELEQKRNLIRASTLVVEQAYNGTDLEELLDQARAAVQGVEVVTKDVLIGREYDGSNLTTKPVPLYEAAGTTICTPGNLTCLRSQAKAGKSAVVGAMIGSVLAGPGTSLLYDTLGFTSSNKDNKAVIHLDTELSKYDWQQMIGTAKRRVSIEQVPDWFHSYHLTGLPARDCAKLVPIILKRLSKKHHGIHSLFVDGVADLVVDPNNPEECFPLITTLHSQAIEHQCAIVLVLHQNPGSENEKGRGHLGSQLERKAESNLTMEKTEDTTKVWATQQRGKMITKGNALAFRWSDELGMHVTCERPGGERKLGRTPKHDLGDIEMCFPKRDQKHLPMSVIFKRVQGITPLPRNSFRDLCERERQNGRLDRIMDDVIGPAFRLNYDLVAK